MKAIEYIKSLFAKREATNTVKFLYAPAKTRAKLDSGIDLFTVKITGPLYKKGRRSGFTGRVMERGGEYRSFRFDRIVSPLTQV